MRFSLFTGIATATLLLALSETSVAGPITGTVNLSGAFQPTENGVSTQNMAQANGIDFLPLQGGTDTFTATSGTGSLSLFSGYNGTIEDLTFAPFSAVSSFFTITVDAETLTFDLANITVDAQSAHHLGINGTGTLHLTGFDDTAGTWNFDGDSSNGASPKATFSWTATVDPPPVAVAEPPMLGLLTGFVFGIGLFRHRETKRRKTA
jgi:hypothetical protein